MAKLFKAGSGYIMSDRSSGAMADGVDPTSTDNLIVGVLEDTEEAEGGRAYSKKRATTGTKRRTVSRKMMGADSKTNVRMGSTPLS